jgi:hypothetical protein
MREENDSLRKRFLENSFELIKKELKKKGDPCRNKGYCLDSVEEELSKI